MVSTYPQFQPQFQPQFSPQQAPAPFAQPLPQQFAPQFQLPIQPRFSPQQPAQPLAQGSIDDFYAQPTVSGGPSVSWKDAQIGAVVVGIVAHDVTSSDIQQETNTQGLPQFYRDGRPKFVMRLPLRVAPDTTFPDGQAVLYVKGQLRDELQRAMSAAGVSGAPRAGAAIQVTLTGRRAARTAGFSPANQFAVVYQDAPETGAPAQAPAPLAPQPVAQVPQQPPAPQVQAPQFQAPQAAPQPVAPQSGALEGFTPEQAALFARLAGQA